MSDIGILYIAHGSKDHRWVEQIDRAVDQVKSTYPYQVGYLENVPKRSIAEAIEMLELKVRKIIIVPLFMCSGSTHLEEIKFSLGLIPSSRKDTDLPIVRSRAELIWGYPMDDHPFMAQIVIDRLYALSERPDKHAILFVAHGSEHRGFKEVWQEKIASLVEQVERVIAPLDVDIAYLSSGHLEQKARELSEKMEEPILVVPLFVSPGYFTAKHIPKHIAEIDAIYSGDVFLPHSLVVEWMKEQVEKHIMSVQA